MHVTNHYERVVRALPRDVVTAILCEFEAGGGVIHDIQERSAFADHHTYRGVSRGGPVDIDVAVTKSTETIILRAEGILPFGHVTMDVEVRPAGLYSSRVILDASVKSTTPVRDSPRPGAVDARMNIWLTNVGRSARKLAIGAPSAGMGF